MTKKLRKPFGAWVSTISAEDVAQSAPKLSEPSLHDGWLYWLQSIADEKGRTSLFCRKTENTKEEASSQSRDACLIPAPFSIRSKVHEYGGKSYCIAERKLYFVNADDQQIYMCDITHPQANEATENIDHTSPIISEPKALTKTPNTRYGELSYDNHHQLLICIAETHFPEAENHKEPENFIAGIPINNPGPVLVLAQGQDFYAYPKVSPNGKFLSYIAWNHPNLPWDTSSLHLLDLSPLKNRENEEGIFESATPLKDTKIPVKPGSVLQPSWSANDDLFFVSDNDNWWNIYSIHSEDLNVADSGSISDFIPVEKITNIKAEFATPLWTLGMSTFAFMSDDTILATYTQNGLWFLSAINIQTKELHTFNSQASAFRDIASGNPEHSHQACFIFSSPIQNEQIGYINKNSFLSLLNVKGNNTKEDNVKNDNLKKGIDEQWSLNQQKAHLDLNNISIGEKFAFKSNEREAYAFYYAPQNKSYESLNTEQQPPVIVICHGGPTGQTTNTLNLKIQYWTNRGFAVIDVNYTGSTGYGREFRHALYGQWGVYDVEDLVHAVEHASEQGWINKDQKIIKGSSAGGYSVLACLAFTDTFNAGVCLYGIGDLELLAKDTHKFEARYLDQLIGAYPKEKELYQKRSPIYSTDTLGCPLLIFQGLEDKVVPPNQARAMADALRKKQLPLALVEYPDEGHGFRNPKNVKHMMESELFFYQKIFNIELENTDINHGPITIENM